MEWAGSQQGAVGQGAALITNNVPHVHRSQSTEADKSSGC